MKSLLDKKYDYAILFTFIFNTIIFQILGLLNFLGLRNFLFLFLFFLNFILLWVNFNSKIFYLSKTCIPLFILYLTWLINLILSFMFQNSTVSTQFYSEVTIGLRSEFIALLLSLSYLFIGLFWRKINNLKFFKSILIIAIIILIYLVVTLIGFYDSSMALNFSQALDNDIAIGYQGLGDALGFLAICITFDKKNKILNIIIAIFFLITIFVIGSRAAFYSYFIVLIIFLFELFKLHYFFLGKFSYKSILMFLFIVFVLCLSGSFVAFLVNNEFIISNRNFELLSQDPSTSLDARNYLLFSSLKNFNDYFLFGNFLGQITLNEFYGSYIHNFLDGLYQFGIIFFICYLYLIFYLIFSRKMKVVYQESYSLKYLTFFCLLEAVFFRNHVYPYIFILFGIAISSYRKTSLQKKSKMSKLS